MACWMKSGYMKRLSNAYTNALTRKSQMRSSLHSVYQTPHTGWRVGELHRVTVHGTWKALQFYHKLESVQVIITRLLADGSLVAQSTAQLLLMNRFAGVGVIYRMYNRRGKTMPAYRQFYIQQQNLQLWAGQPFTVQTQSSNLTVIIMRGLPSRPFVNGLLFRPLNKQLISRRFLEHLQVNKPHLMYNNNLFINTVNEKFKSDSAVQKKQKKTQNNP